MAQVTLRDLASNEDIVVPQEGYLFGRAGGDADIQIEDDSISRRQARVAFKNGRWVLETLAVPQGQRAPKPLALQEGVTFSIGASDFEVVAIDEEEGEVDPQARTFAPTKGKPAPSGKPEKTATGAPAPPPKRAPTAQISKEEDEAPPADIKALFAGVPKGIAYYLVNVPKLLVNPLGTVRKTIEEQPHEPLGRTGLIGFALPALLASALLGSISSGIATLIAGGGFSFSAFVPIGPAIGAVVGAVISGFVFHPVLEWVINKLQGKSDARSRSNYFLQTMTLTIVLAVPSALGTLLSALPVPFIGLVGLVLGVLASLVSVYVTYQWFVHFDVVKWARLVVLGLGGLLVVLGVVGLVRGVIAGVSGVGAAVVATPAGDVAVPEGVDPEAAEAAGAEAVAKALAAKAEAEQRIADAQKGVEKPDGKDAPAKGEKAPPPEKPAKVEPPPEKVAKVEPPPAKETPPPPPEKVEPPAEVAAPTPTKAEAPPAKEAPPVKDSGYAAFARKRDGIEKLFESDPTVLAKSKELQNLYAAYLEAAFELDKKYGKDNAKHPERRKLNAHLRDAELYGKTGRTIDQLAGKLGIR
jgi:outer membrane biosynthesis protein TonB